MIGVQSRSLRFDHAAETPEHSLQPRIERPSGPISRVVGLYQTLLRKTLEHFFPNAILEVQGDRSIIDWDGSPDETHYRFTDDPDSVAIEIEWLGTRLSFHPESPVPLLPLERRMVEIVVQALDRRFRGLFDQDLTDRVERFQYLIEDLIVTDFLQPVEPLSRSRRAGSPAGGRAFHLREPPGLDGGAAAGNGQRSGLPGANESRGGASV